MSSCIRVALRIRPEAASDENGNGGGEESCVHVSSAKSVQVKRLRELTGDSSTQQYTFDNVFSAASTQEEVFTSVRDLIGEALLGYNVTVFAFGMTGSGKTFTISGTQQQPGIVPRTVHHVFSSLRQHAQRHKENVAMVFLSFVELYNNSLHDLLAPDTPSSSSSSSSSSALMHAPAHTDGPIKIHEHPQRGIQLSGSPGLRTPVASAEEALALIARGNKGRATGNTNLNERSSRSHTVITLEILSRSTQAPSSSSGGAAAGAGPVTAFGKVNLVDLAGSERVKMSGAEGQTLVEAQQINKALSVLGDVLSSLSKFNLEEAQDRDAPGHAAAPPHIPYRNSKLTMLLKDSLGGNAKTMMIATVRPGAAFFSQTLTSLKYAARARHIRCHPVSSLAAASAAGLAGPGGGIQKTLEEVSRLRGLLEERTREGDALKKRLEVLERERVEVRAERERRGDAGQASAASASTSSTSAISGGTSSSSSAARGEAEADRETDRRLGLEMAAYRQQLQALQQQSQAERRLLQENMRKVIHSHEGALADKEREFVTLELQLAQQQARIDALARDKQVTPFAALVLLWSGPTIPQHSFSPALSCALASALSAALPPSPAQTIVASTQSLEQERASLQARLQRHQADSLALQMENGELKRRVGALADQR